MQTSLADFIITDRTWCALFDRHRRYAVVKMIAV